MSDSPKRQRAITARKNAAGKPKEKRRANLPDPMLERSAENWFLDAAAYAKDGDIRQAIAAARRGIAALEGAAR